MSHRINQLAENIVDTLKERINRCVLYSLTLDESTDISDTAQLVVFVRGVTDTFEITDIFFDMTSIQQPLDMTLVNTFSSWWRSFNLTRLNCVASQLMGHPQ